MREFKFLCPECGQKILGDAAYSGEQIACPTCKKTITIPAEAAAAAPAPAGAGPGGAASLSAPKTALRPPPLPRAVAGTPERLSGLAAASLICSVFVPLGWAAGIVCGHGAKARMRRTVFLRGERLADAGLLVSYGMMAATFAAAGIFFAGGWRYRPVMATPEAVAAAQARVVDAVVIGQNEDDHEEEGVMDFTREVKGQSSRSARRGGSFGYVMKVLPDEAMTLDCRYWGSEGMGHVFDIAVNGRIIATQDLADAAPGRFFDMEYKIPRSLTAGKEEAQVVFQAHPGMTAGGLYGCETLKP
ncbi:MAG: hypothetical protein KGR98_04360 [Verrucomicrobia bacterium]|nr:hypothetical protein [Verrucomicrobiota bacterium]